MLKRRNAHTVVLAAWAAFFLVLWLTGAEDRYVGPRTQWIVPFGGLALLVVAFLSRRARSTADLTLREGIGLACLLAPVLAVVLVPRAELGAYAAAHKSGDFFPRVAPRPPASPEDVTFLDIRLAEKDHRFAIAGGIHDGLRVRLRGIVTREGRARFELARFYITCCVADAMPVGLPVDAHALRPRLRHEDEWLDVTGRLSLRHGRYVLVADGERRVRAPSNPYLSFVS
jgi:uncharacterized repeat protein (TIGR03943 family)